MGQPVAVAEKPSTKPGMVRFETNRTFTGMGHERFSVSREVSGNTPAAVLARRLFATGRVDAVHVYQHVVTVDLRKGFDASGLKEVVENLYVYYTPDWVPPVFEEAAPAAEAAVDDAAPAASAGAPADALSEAAKRVPAHLLERSRLAKERLKGQ